MPTTGRRRTGDTLSMREPSFGSEVGMGICEPSAQVSPILAVVASACLDVLEGTIHPSAQEWDNGRLHPLAITWLIFLKHLRGRNVRIANAISRYFSHVGGIVYIGLAGRAPADGKYEESP